ncbi:hypothetical protein ACTXT7_014292 [Hymenolepis weldensis]
MSSSVLSGEDIEIDTDLQHLKNLDLQYGYPLDAFGGMFPTFSVEAQEADCDTNSNTVWELNRKNWRCKYAIAIVHGTFGASKYIHSKKVIDFSSNIGDDKALNETLPTSWTNDIYKIGTVPIPSYLQSDIYPSRHYSRVSGLISSDRLKESINLLNGCIPKLARKVDPLRMRPLACNYARFLKVMLGKIDFGADARLLVPPVDSKTLSSLYWLLFCKHVWSNVIRRLGVEGLEYNYHPSCPNPCARYHGNPCLGKANVFQLAKGLLERTDERQDRFFGAQICRHITDSLEDPGYATLSDHAYECICKRGYRWSNHTRSCVLINGCKGQSTCDPLGTRICVSSVSTISSVKALPFTCLCHPGYMGTRCEKKRDACIETGKHKSILASKNENPDQMSGNQACRVFLGNTCEPRIGTNFYTCHCNGLFIADKLPWEGWSGCSAAICTGLGWRHRLRHCRVNISKLEEEGLDKGLCEGEDIQRQLCKATCPAAVSPYILCLKIIVVFCLGCVILVGAVGLLFLRVKVEVE